MYEVKNKNDFPLIINLDAKKSLHLCPFGVDKIEDKFFESPDLKSKLKRKLISISSIIEEVAVDGENETANVVIDKKTKIAKNKEIGGADNANI